MKNNALVLVFVGLFLNSALMAEEREADHAALRKMLASVTLALNEHKSADVMPYLDKECSLIFVDQTIVRNQPDLDQAFAKWFGPESAIAQVQFKPTVEVGTIFTSSDAGWCTGRSDDVYTLKDGRSAVMTAHWTVSLVKRDGAWRISTLHAGVDPQANPILDVALSTSKKLIGWTAVITLGLGLIAGLIIARLLRRS